MRHRDEFFSKKQEWSYVKDRVLGEYLKVYLNKLAMMKSPIILIDGFAGKGKFDEGNLPGSPMIIANLIDEYHNCNSNSNFSPASAYFIEIKHCDELVENMKGFKRCTVLKGDYKTQVNIIYPRIKGKSVFLYLDPFGIKDISLEKIDEIKRHSPKTFEVLINLNTKAFLREACRIHSISLLNYNDLEEDDDYINPEYDECYLNDVAGGTYWIDIVKRINSEITFYEAEEQLAEKYLEAIREKFEYAIDIPIKKKLKNCPVYRLIFGTNHEDGLILMCDTMHKSWSNIIEMSSTEKNQINLFELDINRECFDVDSCLNKFEVPGFNPNLTYNLEKAILNELEDCGPIQLKDFCMRLINKYKIYFKLSDYRNKIKELEGNKIKITWTKKTDKGKISKSMDLKNDTTLELIKNGESCI